jgi:signal transduction histidine kinase
MKRPLHVWITFVACLGLLLAATGWVVWHTLGLESARERAAVEADRQERVRLALWRMDFQASSLLLRENARPPHDFRAFHAPEGVVGKDNDLVKKGEVLAPSPLLADPPEHVMLHFQIDARGEVRSPQVPQNDQRGVALALFVNEDAIKRGEERLQKLKNILAKSEGKETNREVLIRLSCVNPLQMQAQEMPQSDANSLRNNNWAAQQGTVASAPAQQIVLNSIESVMRSRAVAQQSEESIKQQSKPLLKESSGKLELADKAAYDEKAAAEPKPAANRQMASGGSLSRQESLPTAAAPAPAATAAPGKPAEVPADAFKTMSEPDSAMSYKPFKGVWIDDALILTREAWVDGARIVQGVWLDWPTLRQAWLGELGDLFPNATLEPAANAEAGERPQDDPLRFAALPVRLVPGMITLPDLPFWTPLRRSLAAAVACVLIAALAVALLLYGTVALSERRAAFVSAVTHELRTPLTTFRLYSEMLADDMVKDEAQKKTYLETLTGEAGRLSHLVENVLAYAKLERGSAKTRAEHTTIGSLLDRLLPRLKQRASECDMDVVVHATEADRQSKLHIDTAAVEQILFNLVDNACKYAAPRAAQPVIHVEAVTGGKFAMLRVRDHGAGIARGEQRRIFHPFHKSADQAAHSAPGVGLGLALCRRLAAALGGEITLDTAWKDGACFVVRLPVA